MVAVTEEAQVGRPPTFEERYQETCHWIDKRRHKWELHLLAWEDARQRIIIRVWRKYHLYDPAKGEYSHWLNKLITQEWKNIMRDEYTMFSKPCILKCPFNAGDGMCSKTPSGLQCAECPLYADWIKRKGDQFAVRQTLPMETHSNEVYSQQSDFIDIDGKTKLIHAEMKRRLNRAEWKAYRLLYIKHLPEPEVARQMGFRDRPKKRGQKRRMYSGYLALLAMKHHFKAVAAEIIEDQGLAA